ncbi:MAG TPA: cell division protein FtsA [Anaerolineae bacterium]|nr:cell division protein FtsA [Anaerolineae bacterium]
MERTIVGIDVGTTKICTLVGEATDNDLRIVGVGIAPARGIKKGVVVNVVDAASAIKTSIEKAERSSGYEIARAFVSVTGAHISAINSRGVVGVSRGDRGISGEDVNRALEAARAIAIPQDREVLHVIPRGYTIDGQDGVKEPIGMSGFRLEVEAHIVTGQTSSIHNLLKCVENCNVGVDGLVLDAIASGAAVLSDNEKDMGVVLADIGGGTTDIAIFIEGSVWHTTVLAVGGAHITNDIAVGLRVPAEAAELLKLEHGHARYETIDPTEVVQVKAFGDGGLTRVQRRDLAEIIEARTEEIYQLILQEIKRSGYDGLLPAGVVVTGGTAQLRGMRDLGRQVLSLPVRIGQPQGISGLIDTVNSPAYATPVGLLLWGRDQAGQPVSGPDKNVDRPVWGGRLSGFFKKLLPDRNM